MNIVHKVVDKQNEKCYIEAVHNVDNTKGGAMQMGYRGIVFAKFKNITEFAEAVGWSRNKASRIVNGVQEPNANEMEQMANVLGVKSPEEFAAIFLNDCTQCERTAKRNEEVNKMDNKETARSRGEDGARLMTVIETTAIAGRGIADDPVRELHQYWSLDGKLLRNDEAISQVDGAVPASAGQYREYPQKGF